MLLHSVCLYVIAPNNIRGQAVFMRRACAPTPPPRWPAAHSARRSAAHAANAPRAAPSHTSRARSPPTRAPTPPLFCDPSHVDVFKGRHGSFYKALSRAPRSPPREGQHSVTREKLRGEAPMHCLRRPFTSAVLPRRGCGSAPWPRRGASAMPAASRCGCAAPLGSISTSLTGAPPSSFEWSPPSEPCHG